MKARLPLLAAGMVCALLSMGCSRAPSASPEEITRLRDQYLLQEEPPGVVTVLDVRDSLADGFSEVAIVGRIGGREVPWDVGRAAFMITDPSVEDPVAGDPASPHSSGHGPEGHDPKNCPFCRKNEKADSQGLAIVQFHDDQGMILPVDARDLFGVEPHQTVVVNGQASVDAIGNLVIAARGLYVRR